MSKQNLSTKLEELKDTLIVGYKERAGSSVGAVISTEVLIIEFVKELKETISSSQCRVKNFLEYNDDHCLSEKLVLHHLAEKLGDALCTKDEVEA